AARDPHTGCARPPLGRQAGTEAVEEQDLVARLGRIWIARALDRIAVGIRRRARRSDRAGVAVVADAVPVLVVGAARGVLAEVFAVRDPVAVGIALGRDADRAALRGEVANLAVVTRRGQAARPIERRAAAPGSRGHREREQGAEEP